MEQGANFYKAYLNKYLKIENYNSLIPLSSNLEKTPKYMKDVVKKLCLGLLEKLKKNK